MASSQVGDFMTPDMLLIAYNQALTSTPPTDYLGVILLEITRKKRPWFYYVNP